MGYTWVAPSVTDSPARGCLIAPVVAVGADAAFGDELVAGFVDDGGGGDRDRYRGFRRGSGRVVNWTNR